MTKERYDSIKDLDHIPLEDFFEYYKEKGGSLNDIREFAHIFTVFTQQNATVAGSDGILKEITLEGASRRFHRHYKQKFGYEH